MEKGNHQKNRTTADTAKTSRPKDHVAAEIAKCKPLCERGDTKACIKLAKIYLFEVCPPHIDEALAILRGAIIACDPSLTYFFPMPKSSGDTAQRCVDMSCIHSCASEYPPLPIDGVARTDPHLRSAIRLYLQAEKMREHKNTKA